jgi:hypothetical protein
MGVGAIGVIMFSMMLGGALGAHAVIKTILNSTLKKRRAVRPL